MLRRIGPLLLTVQLVSLSAAPSLHGAAAAAPTPRVTAPRQSTVVPARRAAPVGQGGLPAATGRAAEAEQPRRHGRLAGSRTVAANIGPPPSISFSDQNQDPAATPCIAAPSPTRLVVPGDTLLVTVNGFAAATPLTISINNIAPAVYAAPGPTETYTVPSGTYTDTAFPRVTDGGPTVTEALIVGAVLTVSTTIGESGPPFYDTVQVHDSTGDYDVSSSACAPSGSTPLVTRFAVPPDSHLEITTAPYVNSGAAVAYAPISADVVITAVNRHSMTLNYATYDPYTISGMAYPAPLTVVAPAFSGRTAGPPHDLDAANQTRFSGALRASDNLPIPDATLVSATGPTGLFAALNAPYSAAVPPTAPFTFYKPAAVYGVQASDVSGTGRTSNTGTADTTASVSVTVAPQLVLMCEDPPPTVTQTPLALSTTPGTPSTPTNTPSPADTPTATNTMTTPGAATATNTPPALDVPTGTSTPTATSTLRGTGVPTPTSTPPTMDTSTTPGAATATNTPQATNTATAAPIIVVADTATPEVALATSTATPTTPPATFMSTPTPQPNTAGPTNTATYVPTQTPIPMLAPPDQAATTPTVMSLIQSPTSQESTEATPTATSLNVVTATQAQRATATPTATAATLIPVTSGDVPRGQAAVLQALVTPPGPHGEPGQPEVFRLLIPVGAFSRTANLRIAVAAGAPALQVGALGQANNVPIGSAFDLSARDASTGEVISGPFDQPVTLQLSYDPAELGSLDPTTLRIAYFDAAARSWVALDTTVDRANTLLTARVAHFTLFQVRATARAPAQVDQARARLAARGAAGPPQVSVLPGTDDAAVVDAVPVLVTLPSGLIDLPLVVLVTGKPGATVAATFALGGASVSRQRVTLDRRGYAQVRYAPLTTDTKPRGGRLTVVVSGALNSQTFSTGFTVLPGRGPAGSRPALLARSPSLGLRVRVTLPVPIARRGQTIIARISTAPLAPVQVAVYVGHQRIASGSGRTDRRGTFSYRLTLSASLLKNVSRRQRVLTAVFKATARSGGHTANGETMLLIRS